MNFVYLLEDDPKFQKEVVEAIFVVDPKIQVRLFPKLENFVSWTKLMMTVGVKALAQGGEIPKFIPGSDATQPDDSDRLVLVISKVEYLGAGQLGLLHRSRDLFIQRGLCSKEDPTAFVLTAFDDPNFVLKPLQDEILSNVIFKPFDRLILIQHLTVAIEGHHPPSKTSVANQKTTAILELLKDVPLEAISDIGVVTKSNREIPVGSVSKYYGKVFLSDRQRSLFAVCQNCSPHPDDPESFRGIFTFFAPDQTQISNIRKITRNKTAKEFAFDSKNFFRSSQDSELNIILLDEKENTPEGLLGQLPKRFESVQVTPYSSFSALMSDLDPGQAVGQKDANLKALDGATTVTLTFDSGGVIYLGFESDKKGQEKIFGESESELKAKHNWFASALASEQREKYRKYVQTQALVEDNVLSLTVGENSFLVKATELKKQGNKFQITISELEKDQQILWLEKNSRLRKKVHLIIATSRLFGEGAQDRWARVRELLKIKFGFDPVIMMIAKKGITDAEKRSWGTYVQEIFIEPLDKSYFYQKIKSFFPRILDKGDKVEIKAISFEDTIKAVNPVTVIEISEAGFTMRYNRPISLGSFREIVLWQAHETEAPELLASCNFVEESTSEKGVYNCQFVFFGITDASLKHIRIWMRDNYILSKDPAT